MKPLPRHAIRTFLALVLGLIAILFPWKTPIYQGGPSIPVFLQEGIPKLGDALVIAVFVALLVDKTIKAELLSKFTREVSPHIIGNLLPPALRERMLKYLTAKLVRPIWSIDYTIEAASGCDRCIDLTTISQYEVENLSNEPVEYVAAYEIEDTWKCGQAHSVIKSLQVIPPCGHESLALGEEQLQGKNSKSHLFASTTTRLPPTPHKRFRFLTESVEHFPDAFESSFITRQPVLKSTVTVAYPKDQFWVDLNLSCDDGGMPPQRIELAKGMRWEIACPLLPGQCVLVSWGRKSTSRALGAATV